MGLDFWTKMSSGIVFLYDPTKHDLCTSTERQKYMPALKTFIDKLNQQYPDYAISYSDPNLCDDYGEDPYISIVIQGSEYSIHDVDTLTIDDLIAKAKNLQTHQEILLKIAAMFGECDTEVGLNILVQGEY
jgi:hypothetical protein